MPIYDFVCNGCHTSRPVLVDYEAKKGLELTCSQCGGIMKAAEISMFNVIGSAKSNKTAVQKKVKSCGHTHHCQCAAIKQSKPNPFQKQIDQALGKTEH
ncbi:MAG: hypothetical protein CVU89_10620 [Firmicutes bacterium HGW-Firmicutes-14]|jgi:hypothetical protein|nr:MAG: hypothetical protein CVU89_10620 [Firmicutes bacterium HGW-Firmicutes-14]